ncbi:flavodoxin family protein [Clostridium saccharobutylicum]|uniref:Flavodoxin n=2 Tax=Clostridium saccharobutylicum TaxID=169679 RepID=FLAV_CLOSA|nr:flavodoxin family protein [Clostridium saccharobutylicum]P18855.1 RecName: Full=Flavodoxin [Clostridium saccharobutylicum]pir/A38177/ flavodoxin - Clostridium acetobutylicum [Clostridium acetobutylicum]AAA23238.1 flavodoxin [Clostridium saccharobutylicum]AGX41868.1 flavodoxin FloX [Clostridium saccharobutylicum DSM 13864]AQR89142.1 flavodoxin [Clostridium saccharobutylicum]AQR99043.1 flavodoxin [Clostridium saccharobutylicum]AQS08766.1 flavodoxin [Clostridium saccharobutylicum]
MKISILYSSKTGKTERVAKLIEEGVKRSGNIEVKTMNLDAVDKKFLQESEGIIFGTPTYYANISWEMKKWIDESSEFNLEGKLGAAFSTANSIAGGSDIALLTILNHLMVKGMLVYSGGVAFGKPKTHLGYVHINEIQENEDENARIFGERIANKVKQIF